VRESPTAPARLFCRTWSRPDGPTSRAAAFFLIYPCPRCGLEVASRFRDFHVENLRGVGWQLFMPATYVNWCGLEQEGITMPLPDGRVTFVPVLGEAR
jgi:hypothetical protein